MTALDRNPTTTNNLLPNRFRFELRRAPNVEFWMQRVMIPGFSITPTEQPNPMVSIPISGEHIDYETLGVTMLVDSELSNYLEIYTWLRGLGKPVSFDQYRGLVIQPAVLDEGVTSEIILSILNGQQKPKYQFIFHGAFPIALGSMELYSTDSGLARVTCNVEFKYTYFDIVKLN